MAAKQVRLSPDARAELFPGADRAGVPAMPGSSRSSPGLRRRELLTSTAVALLFSGTTAEALVIKGNLPWASFAGTPPNAVQAGPWVFFTSEEGATVEALVDRLIPPDPQAPGGKDAGCAVFIDRQLAGPYGTAEALYMRGPFVEGIPGQGYQSPLTPAAWYRHGLAALDKYCRATHSIPFINLSDDQKDKLISGLENGSVRLDGVDGQMFFQRLLGDTREGFFADPVYGGNRDMAGWKMIGFPGARYDYRDWVERHNERYPLPPLAITGRPDWKQQKT